MKLWYILYTQCSQHPSNTKCMNTYCNIYIPSLDLNNQRLDVGDSRYSYSISCFQSMHFLTPVTSTSTAKLVRCVLSHWTVVLPWLDLVLWTVRTPSVIQPPLPMLKKRASELNVFYEQKILYTYGSEKFQKTQRNLSWLSASWDMKINGSYKVSASWS